MLNHLTFLKWEINLPNGAEKYQLMVLMEILRKRKGYQHVYNYFQSYCLHLNEILYLLNPSL